MQNDDTKKSSKFLREILSSIEFFESFINDYIRHPQNGIQSIHSSLIVLVDRDVGQELIDKTCVNLNNVYLSCSCKNAIFISISSISVEAFSFDFCKLTVTKKEYDQIKDAFKHIYIKRFIIIENKCFNSHETESAKGDYEDIAHYLAYKGWLLTVKSPKSSLYYVDDYDEDRRVLEDDVPYIRSRIRRLKNSDFFGKKKIAIFGSWTKLRLYKQLLEYEGLVVDFVMDNDKSKVGKSHSGIKVFSPEAIASRKDAIILLFNNAIKAELLKQLIDLNVGEERIAIVEPNNEMLFSAHHYIDRIKNGFQMLYEIRREYPEHYILPYIYKSIGDLYIQTGMLMQNYDLDNVLILLDVNNKKIEKLASVLGYKNFKYMTSQQIESINSIIGYYNKDLGFLFSYADSFIYLYCYGLTNFYKRIYSMIYGYSQIAKFSFPKFSENQESAKEKFNKLGLIKNRTVFFSPYSLHYYDIIPPSEWERMADYFISMGFTVFTNCHGSERPIKNTVTVDLGFKELREFLRQCGHFVGIRSGLTDLFTDIDCKKIIFYIDYSITDNPIEIRRSHFGFKTIHKNPYCRNLIELSISSQEDAEDCFELVKNTLKAEVI